MRILVAGATGYVGSRLAAELLKGGHEVIAATRNPGRLAGFGWHDKVTGVALDADDPTSVRAAFAAAGPVDVNRCCALSTVRPNRVPPTGIPRSPASRCCARGSHRWSTRSAP